MNKSEFLKLLHKYLEGNATEEERRFFSIYYKLFDAECNDVIDLKEKEKEEFKINMQEEIWKEIKQNEEQEKKVKSLSRGIIKISAAVLILAIGAFGISNFYQQPTKNNTVVVRVGQGESNRMMRLADGSTIIVQAGSELKFPSTFDGLSRREVSLQGQAYFDVQHGSKPFIIYTRNLKTTVLGTAFNIKAYPDDENTSVVVTRGRVQVSNRNKILGIVNPHQQLIYNNKESKVVQKNVSKEINLNWKRKRDLLITNITLSESASLLEAQYNISIIIKDDLLGSKKFTTTFLKEEGLEQVLKSICEFNDAVYIFNQEKDTVYINAKTNESP